MLICLRNGSLATLKLGRHKACHGAADSSEAALEHAIGEAIVGHCMYNVMVEGGHALSFTVGWLFASPSHPDFLPVSEASGVFSGAETDHAV